MTDSEFRQDLLNRRNAILARLDEIAAEKDTLQKTLAPLETLLRLEGIDVEVTVHAVSQRMSPAEKEAIILHVLAEHEGGPIPGRELYERAGLEDAFSFDGFRKAMERLAERGVVVGHKDAHGPGTPYSWKLAK